MQSSTFTDPEAPSKTGDGASPGGSRVSEAGQKAADAIDAKRGAVAGGIESAAASLRERVERLPVGDNIARSAEATADALESAADYVRDRDARGMLSDAGKLVADHPGAALLTAATLGFLLARAITRN